MLRKKDIYVRQSCTKKYSFTANSHHLWAFGVAVVIGGQLYGWNAGFQAGFGSYAIAQILMGLAYIVLMLCIAEISSALQFSGGCYGLARVVVGFYPGFIVGYLQLIEFTVYTSAAVLFVSDTITSSCEIDTKYGPLFSLLLYVVMVRAVTHDEKSMWTFAFSITLVSLFLLIVYVLGSYGWTDFGRFAALSDDSLSGSSVWFNGGFRSFLSVFPYTTWSYGGIESVALTISQLEDPVNTFRDGSIAAVLTLFVTNMLLLFSWACQPPGISYTMGMDYPMSTIYTAIFDWPVVISNLLVIPGNIAMAFGFVYPSGKLLQSLSDSNLFPTMFKLSGQKTTDRAVIYCAVFGYAICCFGLITSNLSSTLSGICILTAYITYFSILYGFFMLRVKYDFIVPQFRSPLGLTGAVFASVVFGLGTVSSIGFQEDNFLTVIVTVVFIFALTVYYYVFAMKGQKLSEEEHKSVFRLHVVKYNMRRQASSKGSLAANKSPSGVLNSNSNKGRGLPSSSRHSKIHNMSAGLEKASDAVVEVT